MSSKRKAASLEAKVSNGKQRLDEQEENLLDGFPEGEGEDLLDFIAGDEDAEGVGAVEDEDEDFQTGLEAEVCAPQPEEEEVELPLSAQHLQSEEELDFSSLTISAAQARRMAPLICSNDALTTIKFEGHSLSVSDLKEEDELEWDSEDYTDVEAILIAEFLKTNTSIKRLDLARNLIADDGACALAAALSENTTLEYLNLESNSVAEKGGTALGRAGAGSNLQYLNLAFNAIPSAVQQAIRDLWTQARQGQLGLHL